MKSGSLIAAGFFLHTFFPQYSELQIEKHNSYPVIFYSIKTQVRQRPLGPRVRGGNAFSESRHAEVLRNCRLKNIILIL